MGYVLGSHVRLVDIRSTRRLLVRHLEIALDEGFHFVILSSQGVDFGTLLLQRISCFVELPFVLLCQPFLSDVCVEEFSVLLAQVVLALLGYQLSWLTEMLLGQLELLDDHLQLFKFLVVCLFVMFLVSLQPQEFVTHLVTLAGAVLQILSCDLFI